MHRLLANQLKRIGIESDVPTVDHHAWTSLLDRVSQAYQQSDQDQYLLERSLSLSSKEMRDLHDALAEERDSIATVLCALDEGVCAISADETIQFINPRARSILRIDADREVVNERLDALVDVRLHDGTPFSCRAASGLSSHATQEIDRRLFVRGFEDEVITWSVDPLRVGADDWVLTLRDITDRKRLETEREELNSRLLDLSRQAGMAEVASNVLHNVGNVLNSVNVSATVAVDVVRDTKAGRLQRVADLIRGRDDSPESADHPANDAMIADYLTELDTELARERDTLIDELTNLRKSTDLIRDIVATQQSYAKVTGTREQLDVTDLIDEATRIVSIGLERHGVRVDRDTSASVAVCSERHQVLQILVNLISNAKQAVESLPETRREISIRVRTQTSNARVCIDVIDHGVGISHEDLTRIFTYGFTTRADGHGFGLHGAAIAAKTLDGSLHARSPGPGQGATFTLELPIADAAPASHSEAA
ncbi:MAG: PAS domain-containing sensor histidine kinase [Phycisphaerales bacterium]